MSIDKRGPSFRDFMSGRKDRSAAMSGGGNEQPSTSASSNSDGKRSRTSSLTAFISGLSRRASTSESVAAAKRAEEMKQRAGIRKSSEEDKKEEEKEKKGVPAENTTPPKAQTNPAKAKRKGRERKRKRESITYQPRTPSQPNPQIDLTPAFLHLLLLHGNPLWKRPKNPGPRRRKPSRKPLATVIPGAAATNPSSRSLITPPKTLPLLHRYHRDGKSMRRLRSRSYRQSMIPKPLPTRILTRMPMTITRRLKRNTINSNSHHLRSCCLRRLLQKV